MVLHAHTTSKGEWVWLRQGWRTTSPDLAAMPQCALICLAMPLCALNKLATTAVPLCTERPPRQLPARKLDATAAACAHTGCHSWVAGWPRHLAGLVDLLPWLAGFTSLLAGCPPTRSSTIAH